MAKCKYQTDNGRCRNKQASGCQGLCRKHFDLTNKQEKEIEMQDISSIKKEDQNSDDQSIEQILEELGSDSEKQTVEQDHLQQENEEQPIVEEEDAVSADLQTEQKPEEQFECPSEEFVEPIENETEQVDTQPEEEIIEFDAKEDGDVIEGEDVNEPIENLSSPPAIEEMETHDNYQEEYVAEDQYVDEEQYEQEQEHEQDVEQQDDSMLIIEEYSEPPTLTEQVYTQDLLEVVEEPKVQEEQVVFSDEAIVEDVIEEEQVTIEQLPVDEPVATKRMRSLKPKVTRPIVKRTSLPKYDDEVVESEYVEHVEKPKKMKRVTFAPDVKVVSPAKSPKKRQIVIEQDEIVDLPTSEPVIPTSEPIPLPVNEETVPQVEEDHEVPMISGTTDWVLATGEKKKVLSLVALLKSAKNTSKASVFVPDYMEALKLAASRDGYLLLNAHVSKTLSDWLLNFKDRTFNLTDTMSIKINPKSCELLKHKIDSSHQLLQSFAQSLEGSLALTDEPKYVFYVAHHSMHWRPEQSSSGKELGAYLWCTTSAKEAINKANSCERHWNPVLVMVRLMTSKHCLPFAKKGVNKASLLLLPQNKIKWLSSKPSQTQTGYPARRIFEGDSFMIAPHVSLYKMTLSD